MSAAFDSGAQIMMMIAFFCLNGVVKVVFPFNISARVISSLRFFLYTYGPINLSFRYHFQLGGVMIRQLKVNTAFL